MIESFIVLAVTRDNVASVTGDKEEAAVLTDHQMQRIANKFENALMEFYWDALKEAMEEVQDGDSC